MLRYSWCSCKSVATSEESHREQQFRREGSDYPAVRKKLWTTKPNLDIKVDVTFSYPQGRFHSNFVNRPYKVEGSHKITTLEMVQVTYTRCMAAVLLQRDAGNLRLREIDV